MQKKKGDGLLLFLKAFCWETNLSIMLGDFTVKQDKIWKGNLYLTENWFSRNKIWCTVDNYICMYHICAKRCHMTFLADVVENKPFRVWPHEAGRLYILGIGDDYGGWNVNRWRRDSTIEVQYISCNVTGSVGKVLARPEIQAEAIRNSPDCRTPVLQYNFSRDRIIKLF